MPVIDEAILQVYVDTGGTAYSSFKRSFWDSPLTGELIALHRRCWSAFVVDATHRRHDAES